MATFLTDTDFRIPSSGGTLDLDALVELSNRRRRTMEEARANVDRRRQDLIDRGQMGPQPLANREAARGAVLDRLPPRQAEDIIFEGAPTAIQVVPNIGRRVDYDGGRVMLGKYGTGSAVNRTEPDPNRKIEGKPAAEWFANRPTYTGQAVVQEAMNKKKKSESGTASSTGSTAVPATPPKAPAPTVQTRASTADKAPVVMMEGQMPNVAYANDMTPEQSLEAARQEYAATGNDAALRRHFQQFPSASTRLANEEAKIWKKIGEQTQAYQDATEDRDFFYRFRDRELDRAPAIMQGAEDQLNKFLLPETYDRIDRQLPPLDTSLIQQANNLNKIAQTRRAMNLR